MITVWRVQIINLKRLQCVQSIIVKRMYCLSSLASCPPYYKAKISNQRFEKENSKQIRRLLGSCHFKEELHVWHVAFHFKLSVI